MIAYLQMLIGFALGFWVCWYLTKQHRIQTRRMAEWTDEMRFKLIKFCGDHGIQLTPWEAQDMRPFDYTKD